MARQRGRKTAGALAAAVSTQRPAPAAHLTDEQAEIWQRVVDSLPPEWFRPETLDLLGEYCVQVTTSRKVAKMIDALPVDAPAERLQQLIYLTEKTARLTISLATKMRISQQSTYDREKVKQTAKKASDPWLTVVE